MNLIVLLLTLTISSSLFAGARWKVESFQENGKTIEAHHINGEKKLTIPRWGTCTTGKEYIDKYEDIVSYARAIICVSRTGAIVTTTAQCKKSRQSSRLVEDEVMLTLTTTEAKRVMTTISLSCEV